MIGDNLLTGEQCGFKKDLSCLVNLTEIEDWASAKDSNTLVVTVFIYVIKVFD